jgi:hypothetical protein
MFAEIKIRQLVLAYDLDGQLSATFDATTL